MVTEKAATFASPDRTTAKFADCRLQFADRVIVCAKLLVGVSLVLLFFIFAYGIKKTYYRDSDNALDFLFILE